MLGEALAAATLVREQSFVWTAVTQELLIRHGVTMDEVEGLIDIIRRTAEADVACVLKEDVDGSREGQPALASARPMCSGSPRPTVAVGIGSPPGSRPDSAST